MQFQRERTVWDWVASPGPPARSQLVQLIKCLGPCSSTRRDQTRDSKSNPPSRIQPVYWQSYIQAEAVPRAGGKLRVAKETRRRSITLSRITCVRPRITDCKNCSRVLQDAAVNGETPGTSSEETGNTFPGLKNDLRLHCEVAAVKWHEENR